MFFKVTKIGNRAVKKAQEENRKNGIPNVYSRDGKIYFELPDGTITTDYSFENITSKQSNPRFT
ncbi:MAG: hypothetical protein H8D22_10910 [Candidatus Cloacimonetes bacterium]|nr:hypothetical protein [Candidatus Cloacimonadota bacterium]